jgi:thiamine-phosphate pyrophosphorylase
VTRAVPFPRSGLYVITDSGLAQDPALGAPGVVEQVRRALAAGARVVQYRDKGQDGQRRQQEAEALQALCQQAAVPLIINDDVELAARVGAAGVHLGKDDPHFEGARGRLGRQAIIGVSCYNRFDLAQQAAAQGADYIAFGRFFPSTIKPDAVHAEPALLERARREVPRPLVAIGGITPENGGTLITAGANLLAVIGAVFGEVDIEGACARFNPLFR